MAAGPSTMMEALGNVVSDVSKAMTTPDADIPFLTSLQGVIVGRMRQGMGGGSAQSQGGQGPAGQPGGAMSPPPGAQPPGQGPPPPGATPPGAPPGAQLSGSPGPIGVQPLAQTPSPDELRRVIAGKAGA